MIKEEVMRKCLSQKFAIPELGTALLATGTAELIEGNSWGDTYWGVCNHAGQNRLGELLMQERSKARMDIDPDILKEYYLRRNELDYFFEYLDANGYDVEAFMEKNEARLDKLANQLDLAIADLLDNLIEADAEGII
jgi:predicted Rossmann fold nucleotide-binding protein DprA/Smf involved in DNA uptake